MNLSDNNDIKMWKHAGKARLVIEACVGLSILSYSILILIESLQVGLSWKALLVIAGPWIAYRQYKKITDLNFKRWTLSNELYHKYPKFEDYMESKDSQKSGEK